MYSTYAVKPEHTQGYFEPEIFVDVKDNPNRENRLEAIKKAKLKSGLARFECWKFKIGNTRLVRSLKPQSVKTKKGAEEG